MSSLVLKANVTTNQQREFAISDNRIPWRQTSAIQSPDPCQAKIAGAVAWTTR